MSDTGKKQKSDITPTDAALPNLKLGLSIIAKEVITLPPSAGVYRMLDGHGNLLYVGKAKHLKKRVTSYSRETGHVGRILKMISLTRSMVFITTHTEAEALLLEANLIKKLKPHFNILLRDDRSFPYILLEKHTQWSKLTKHRGALKKNKGDYFGPFASVSAVNQTLNTLQRVFLLRSCSDSVLENRTRPCLLYQIKRCSAPCVGRISSDKYSQLVDDAKAFLKGEEIGIQKKLAAKMQEASTAQEYEKAGMLRDRLAALTNVQRHQSVNSNTIGDCDVIAAHQASGKTCIQVFFYRAGQNWGNRAYFPRHSAEHDLPSIMEAFLAQFYENKLSPKNILLNVLPNNLTLLTEALSVKADRLVKLIKPKQGAKRISLDHALANAKMALKRQVAEKSSQQKLLEGVAEIFDLDAPPKRIEIYDNSHISGTNAIGAMVVAGAGGFQKNAYRKFNIKSDMSAGDDFAMMKEVLSRRFKKLLKDNPNQTALDGVNESHKNAWPDLLLIDGGKGQLSAVHSALENLGVENVPIVAISKGPDRNAGREQFHIKGQAAFTLEAGHPVLYFLQRLRDESHRFAIGTHRARRAKTIYASPLDAVPGIGAKRKKALLHHFGSAKAVTQAGIKDLEAATGISKAMAQKLYDFFQENV
jgi:excinuclease ABC subunit C